jgi:hypothetical protein
MDKMDYWRFCDDISIVQAALLILGLNPSDFINLMTWQTNEYPDNFNAVFTALTNAVICKKLKAEIHFMIEQRFDSIAEDFYEYETEDPDWDKTMVSVDDIRSWLKSRGVKQGFFFPQPIETQDYLDPNQKNYAPKLAAAIRAWQAVNTDPDLLKGKTVKQVLLKWLRKNADQFGLTKDDGNPNEQGIEEIAKISNWDTKGGAPKTPGK